MSHRLEAKYYYKILFKRESISFPTEKNSFCIVIYKKTCLKSNTHSYLNLNICLNINMIFKISVLNTSFVYCSLVDSYETLCNIIILLKSYLFAFLQKLGCPNK